MSNAYKCDRCGKFYENNKTPTFGKICSGITAGVNIISTTGNTDIHKDLCDGCIAKLKKWLMESDEDAKDDECPKSTLKDIESYIVTVDISEKDDFVTTVAIRDGNNLKVVKKFIGEEAANMYRQFLLRSDNDD